MKKYPLVSVVIATKNEEKNIVRCLESIKNQSYPAEKIEVIVVDNNSGDKTVTIVKKYTKNVYNGGPERSSQRNLGIRKAKGQYLLYLDADMTISPKLIEFAVGKFQTTNYLAFYIPELILGQSFLAKVRNFERSFYNATSIDAVRFAKTACLKKIGGFDPRLTGPEDWDLDKRIRQLGKVCLLKADLAVIYHNESGFSLKKYLIKKNYYTSSFKTYIKKWGTDDPDIKKQFGFFYRFCGVFIENKKWKKLALHPFLTLSIIYLRLFVGLVYLKSDSYVK